jgi:hypothetical protein
MDKIALYNFSCEITYRIAKEYGEKQVRQLITAEENEMQVISWPMHSLDVVKITLK